MSATKRTFIMEPSPNNTTGTQDDETMAFRRKRARRVSFADKEVTSVHVFRRDDTSSSGTPPGSSSSSPKTAPTDQIVEFFRDLAGDSEDDLRKNSSSPPSRDHDDVVGGGRGSFLRPIGSPSPGGSSVSASTDDEDDFHGPVSAGFIRPERLYDSGASDDLTMDSTAFSLHYRSLARSDSGDLKTPTRFRLQFEEKTPSQTSSPHPAPTGSFMVLTEAKKQCSHPGVPVEAATSGCRDSSDMSILGENPLKYDYDELPTQLVKILAEVGKDLHATSPTLGSEATILPSSINGLVIAQGSEDLPMRIAESPRNYECSTSSPVDKVTRGLLDKKGDHTVVDGSVCSIKTPDTSVKEVKEFVKDASVFVSKQLDFLNAGGGRTPVKMGEGNHLNVSALSKLGHSVGRMQLSNSNDRGHVESIASLEERQSSITRENNMHRGLINTDDHGIESFRTVTMSSQNEETVDTKNGEENFNLFSADISYSIKNPKPVGITASPLQMTPLTRVRDCNLVDSMVEKKKDDILSVSGDKPFSSPVKLLDQNESVNSGIGQDVECNSETEANGLGFSRCENSGKTSSDLGLAQLIKFAKSASKRKSSPSPVKRFLLQSTPIQQASTLLSPQHEPLNELHHKNMQDCCEEGNSDGLCPLDNSYHPAKQVTPSQTSSSPAANGSFMIVTEAKKQRSQSGLPADAASDCRDSSDMNMVGESPHSCDYERLPIALDAIIAEGSKGVQAMSPLLDSEATSSASIAGSISAQGSIDSSMDSVGKHDASVKELAEAPCNNGCSISSPVDQVTHDVLDNTCEHTVANASVHQSKTPDTSIKMTHLTRVRDSNGNIVDSMTENRKDHVLSVVSAKPLPSPAKLLDHKLSQHVDYQSNCFDELKQLNKQNESASSGLGQDVERNSEEAALSAERLLLSGGHNKDKLERTNRSPEVEEIGNSNIQLVSERPSSMRGERPKPGYRTWNSLADILKEFFGGTQHLLSPSINKLNLRLICILEDILVHLQKVKQCEILCSEIHPQKLTDPLNFSRRKRDVEARTLLLCILYKKANLQLMHMKRERLLEKVQHLSSGLQESEMMKLKFISCSSKSDAVRTHIHTSLLNSGGKCQVTKMRQEFESLASKAKSLSEFFHSFCKMGGDQSCADILESARHYLWKRMSNKFIFQSLKLWSIEDFELRDGCYRIVLNYGGYIIQRFTVNPHQTSITISNNLNDVNIVKAFPGINVFSAFEFALNTHTTKKCTGSTCLRQEKQITSSLLSNLLDVVEEVQLSRVEIRNLVEATFFSHSVKQLDLLLFFVDFCSGRKVKVTLDMTCIKCGVYPVKVLPSQICGVEHNLPFSLEHEIRTAAESVRVGYSRIIRLCRRISRAIHSGTQST